VYTRAWSIFAISPCYTGSNAYFCPPEIPMRHLEREVNPLDARANVKLAAQAYEDDFYAWAEANAALLRAGAVADIDTENIAEELEGMARSERRELVHRLAALLSHLLKWRYQPEYRGKSWRSSIKEQRRAVKRLLRDSPSLQPQLPDYLADAYGDAVLQAVRETKLDESEFPEVCPFTIEQIMHEPPHPGQVLRESYLEPRELGITQAATMLDISREVLSELLNGQAGIGPEMAVRLARTFDTTPESWLNLQEEYDLWHVQSLQK
jgi:addiction module HigA family antidote